MNRFRRYRSIACALCIMLAFTSCNLQRRGSAPDEIGSGKVGSGVEVPEDEQAETPSPTEAAGGQGEQAPRRTPSSGGGGGGRGATNPSNFGSEFSAEEQRRQAYRYLNGSVPELRVELDYVEGKGPNQQALAFARNYIGQFVDKPGGFEIRMGNAIKPTKDGYTDSEIFKMMEANRETFDTPKVATIYLLYVNGTSKDNPRRLAFAGGDVLVMFPDRIGAAVAEAPIFGRYEAERSILIHELGHLLGLVDNVRSPRKRADPDDPAHQPPNRTSPHSRNRQSVMYYAVANDELSKAFMGGAPPTEFDADDKADMDDVKNGRW